MRRFEQAGSGHARQRGVALAISLVLLVAMTIIGVATLSGTRLNERIASNAQQKAIAFEVAESAIHSAWTVAELMNAIDQIPAAEFNNPAPISPPGMGTALSSALDQTNSNGTSVDVAADVTIQYCGEQILPSGSSLSADESKLQLVGLLFDVNGVADIQNSNTAADHIQRGSLIRPKSGRTGNCTVPGT